VAKQIITRLVDDLDGGEAKESICFAYEGTEYMIDLSEKNAAKLRKVLAPYVQHGVRVTARIRRRSSVPVEDTAQGRALIRDWARKSTMFPGLSDFGRIPVEVVAAYREANSQR
jgi:hypothetical protein